MGLNESCLVAGGASIILLDLHDIFNRMDTPDYGLSDDVREESKTIVRRLEFLQQSLGVLLIMTFLTLVAFICNIYCVIV